MTNKKTRLRLLVIFGLLLMIFIMSNLSFISAQDSTVTVIEVRIDMKVVQSDLNNLYYVQCIDSCERWYQTGDIAELFMAFTAPCQAVNFWKQRMSDTFGDAYVPLLPCP